MQNFYQHALLSFSQVNKAGFVNLIMDLGAGPQTITSNVPVIYNDWIKVSALVQCHDKP